MQNIINKRRKLLLVRSYVVEPLC